MALKFEKYFKGPDPLIKTTLPDGKIVLRNGTVITWEEFEERVRKVSQANFEIYEPILKAFRVHGPELNVDEISEITGRPGEFERKILDRFYKANLAGIKIVSGKIVYRMTEEHLRDFYAIFGL